MFSPDALDVGYNFVDSISSFLAKTCIVELVSVKRYFKIEEYVTVELELIPKQPKNTQDILIFFNDIVDNLGTAWVMEGDEWVWYKNGSSQAGLAAPVEQLIKQLAI